MKKRCFKACEKFIDHFGYCAAFPKNLDFDQDEYADELLKCIEDDFDYTIERFRRRNRIQQYLLIEPPTTRRVVFLCQKRRK